MNKKAISLTLASIFSVQSIAFATQDRTSEIGQEAIQSAQLQLAALRNQVANLERSLETTAQSIEKRDQKGGITNGIAVTGATLGLVAGLGAYLTVKAGHGSGSGAPFLAALSIGTTLLSAVSGLTSQGLKTKVDVKDVETQLQNTRQNIVQSLSQPMDKATSTALMQLDNSLRWTQESVSQYKNDKSSETKTRLAAQATQLAGIAVTMFGVTQKNSGALFIGPALMSTGNVVASLAGLSSEQAETVLKEIQKTRDSLKIVQKSLN